MTSWKARVENVGFNQVHQGDSAAPGGRQMKTSVKARKAKGLWSQLASAQGPKSCARIKFLLGCRELNTSFHKRNTYVIYIYRDICIYIYVYLFLCVYMFYMNIDRYT